MNLKFFFTIFILIAVSFIIISGCGKKTDPRPPEKIIPKPVSDLSYKIENNEVQLSWTVPDNKNLEIDRFTLYKATVKILGNGCKNCPLSFIITAHIPSDKTFYIEPAEKGFRYVFKMVVVDENEVSSKESNVVDFEYQ